MTESQILHNARRDPKYNPYCGRCPGLERMEKVEPFLWQHHCGAVHDERLNASAVEPGDNPYCDLPTWYWNWLETTPIPISRWDIGIGAWLILQGVGTC